MGIRNISLSSKVACRYKLENCRNITYSLHI